LQYTKAIKVDLKNTLNKKIIDISCGGIFLIFNKKNLKKKNLGQHSMILNEDGFYLFFIIL
jgi:hypothetical protein